GYERPAAVVEWRKAPRRVVDPGPAPRLNPGPVAVPVGRPSHYHGSRRPRPSVARYATPGAILIQVLVADHFARNIRPRNRVLFAPPAHFAPAVETVGRRRLAHILGNRVDAADPRHLARMHGKGTAAAGDLRFAAAHDEHRHIVVAIGIDS